MKNEAKVQIEFTIPKGMSPEVTGVMLQAVLEAANQVVIARGGRATYFTMSVRQGTFIIHNREVESTGGPLWK